MTQMESRSSLASRLRDQALSQAVPQLVAETMLAGAAELSTAVKVKGVCPGCGANTLFVGNEGYVTCSLATCGDPTAAHELFDGAKRQQPASSRGRSPEAGSTPARSIETVDGPVGEVGKPPAQYVGKGGLQPFDIIDAFDLDFYEGCALKYLLRWRKKNGTEDLRKAAHYIQEVIAHAGE